MEQHPIPQNISSYEFKLVGEMTLKQFLKAAAGIVLALIINSTKIVFFIKWPLALGFAGLGLALAFVPLEDRPLETWILAFLRSIYSPTIFLYKKRASTNWLDIDWTKKLKDDEDKEEEEKEKNKAIKDGDKVKEFIDSLPSVKRERVDEEKSKVETVQGTNPSAPVVTGAPPLDKGSKTLEVEVDEGWQDRVKDLNLKKEKLEATGVVNFGAIPMPDIPETPNILVGMVTDTKGKIVEGAIVEVQDKNGNPARVLKTNSLGQFKTSNPLADGTYLMVTEKEGYSFDRVNVNLMGKIVEPIRIISN